MTPLSRHALARYIDNYSGDIATDGQLRLIITELDGTPVGVADLYEYSQRDRRAGVGIFIQKEYRRRGYAFQALAWLGVYCATHLGLHQLWAVVGADNDASRALFTRPDSKHADACAHGSAPVVHIRMRLFIR